ncbi:hypothetical protein G7Y89_g15176 [Cudoniella acicularis]|uniref:Uncharacterized protein n=1 Tax=Cudoniella acicularis TaxID=354080 RepID=A0A8H4VQ41_9HELO|nr:hypothetical protein G7Y89_g15176 [Cudoniella acicularis]
MDHLPLPSNPLLAKLEVPYRCTELYDGGPMAGYPSRKGWRILYAVDGIGYLVGGGVGGEMEKPSDKMLEAFLQNWLYFGLLGAVLDELEGDVADGIKGFIERNEEEEDVVRTVELEAVLSRWKEKMKADIEKVEKGKKYDGWKRVHTVIRHVWQVALDTHLNHSGAVDPRILLSIAVLGETIQGVLAEFGEDKELDIPIPEGWRNGQVRGHIGDFLLPMMREKGWCEFDVKRLPLPTGSVGLLWYYAHLQPPRSWMDHSFCGGDECKGMAIGERYRTRHATPDCTCTEEFSDVEAVVAAVEDGKIPLVQFKDGEFHIVRFPGDVNTDFVAISHVWAEGLGNPHANSLPTCTLKWVSSLIDSLPLTKPNTPFFLDTLSVPIFPRSAHILALNSLRLPYTHASHVLVLDSYLLSLPSSTLTPLELWTRILCSSWSLRLWTFQEARLSTSRLHFAFIDQTFQAESLFLQLPTENICTTIMVRDAAIAYRGTNILHNLASTGILPHDFAMQFRPTPDVHDLRQSLKSRAVSVPGDEALCLACIMGMDLSLFTAIPSSNPLARMALFWKLMPRIPLGLVFSTACQKLTTPGLRWAPTSFLGDLEGTHWVKD